MIVVGSKYKITDGRYAGRLCKVMSHDERTYFAIVRLLDSWGKETKETDAVPLSYLER